MIDELRVVLTRGHLATRLQSRLSSVAQAVALYARIIRVVTPATMPRIVTGDADDDHVIAAAVAAVADVIVSGDHHLLAPGQYQGIRIVAPAEALTIPLQ